MRFRSQYEKIALMRNCIPNYGENAVGPTQKPFQCGRCAANRPHFESTSNPILCEKVVVTTLGFYCVQQQAYANPMIQHLVPISTGGF